MKQPTPILVKLDACQAAVEWSRTFKSVEIAWQYCDVGEWMIWLLTHLGTFDHRPQLKAELERFDEAITPARAVFQKLVDQAFAAYRLIEEPARQAREKTMEDADAEFALERSFPSIFDPECRAARKGYREVMQAAKQAYETTEHAADRELKAKLASANKDYAEMIRVILPGSVVVRLIEHSKEL